MAKRQYTLIMKAAAAVCLPLMLCACGGSKDNSDEGMASVVGEGTELLDAIQSKDYARTSILADSLALNVDDLSNSESVAVLAAYLQVHNNASLSDDRQKDLETLRKFVDVYELSFQRDRDGMKEAVAEARRHNSDMDLEALYNEFKGRLAEYDALQGGELTNEPEDTSAKPDSTATDSTGVTGTDITVP